MMKKNIIQDIDKKYTIELSPLHKVFLFCVSFSIVLLSCSEESNKPLGDSGGLVGPVENVEVNSTPGGAIITYDLPKEENLLYVEAELITPEGKYLNYKASSFSDTIKIEGLANTKEQKVKLMTVNKAGRKGESVDVSFTPLEPPYISALSKVKLLEDFGGLRLIFKNETKSPFAYMLYVKNEYDEFVEYGGYYTEEEEGTYTYRGLKNEKTNFALYIRDKYDNISDTLYTELTPLYEEQVETDTFRPYRLQNDAKEYKDQWNISMEYLWDGYYSQDYNNPYLDSTPGAYLNYSIDCGNTIEPQWITFDMGKLVKVSRFRVHHYWRFIMSGCRKWEMWGRPDEPPYDGSIDGWVKLCDMELVKPSGLPGEQTGPGDVEAWEAGTSENADPDAPAIRYVRIRAIEDWNGFANFTASEVIVFGQVVN